MKIKISLILLCFMASCTMAPAPKTTAEKIYLDRVMSTPLVFTIPKENNEDTWGRIQSFIGKYSSMKIQTATDFVIETYNPSESDVKYGYSVTKTPIGDEYEIEVRCYCGNIFVSEKTIAQNAHILAYYALTGEVMPQFIAR